jgi:hypothetical protein
LVKAPRGVSGAAPNKDAPDVTIKIPYTIFVVDFIIKKFLLSCFVG